MTGKKNALAVLLETAEMRQVFAQWPDGMNLAVCLLDSGECRMFLFRREEAAGFPARLRTDLKLPVDGVSIFPAVAGFPTRKLLYSDEQRLLSLVADAPELVEEAEDYSSNFMFALEEGLDPAAFLRRSVVAVPGSQTTATVQDKAATTADSNSIAKAALETAPKMASKPPPVQAAPTKREGDLPAFLRESDIALPGPQFRSASEISAAEEPPGLYRLKAKRNGWFVVERSGSRGGDVRVSNPADIFLRDDRRVIAVRLEPAWPEAGKLPLRILIRAVNLPHSLRQVLAESVGEVRMESDGNFLFLKLPTPRPVVVPASVPVPEPAPVENPAPEVQPDEAALGAGGRRKGKRRPAGRRRWLAAGIASLLVMIGIGLRFGTPLIQSDEPNAAVDWNRYQIGGQPDQSG